MSYNQSLKNVIAQLNNKNKYNTKIAILKMTIQKMTILKIKIETTDESNSNSIITLNNDRSSSI